MRNKREKVAPIIRELRKECLQTCDVFPLDPLWSVYLSNTCPTERVTYEEFVELVKFNLSTQYEFIKNYKDNDEDYFFYATNTPYTKLDTVNGFEAFVRINKYSYGKGKKNPIARYYEAKYNDRSNFPKEKRRFALYCIGHDENYKKDITRDDFNKLTDTEINNLVKWFISKDKK